MADSAATPNVIIISGPSGSGKSTLVARLRGLPGTLFSISCTTRPKRAAESPGKCYDFVSETEFQRLIRQGEFLEYAQVFGRHWYGTPRKWVDEARRQGLDLVLEIDVQGAQQVKRQLTDAVSVFIVPPSRQVIEQRLRARGQDSDEAIARRLDRARQEISCWTAYDFVVVNDDLEKASEDLRAIVLSSRCRRRVDDRRVRAILDTFGGP
jgi:guanylate kinase